jgi:hypothetical protein
MIVFKPLPAKAKTYYSFNQLPSYMYVQNLQSDNSVYAYLRYNYNWNIYNDDYTNNLYVFYQLVDNSTGSIIHSFNFTINSTTYLPDEPYRMSFTIATGPGYSLGMRISKQPLILNNTYTIYLTIRGITYDIGGYSQTTWDINGVLGFKFIGYDKITSFDVKDVSLTFQKYDCDTHIATFGVNIVGYNSVDFSMVSTSNMGKDYVISYVYDNVNKLLKVYFSSDLPTGTITLSLGITCDNTISLLKEISFTNTCNAQQTIQPGKFYITSPPTETKYDSPQVGGDYYFITFNFAYGGNVINDFGSNWKIQDFLAMNIVTPPAVDGGIICDNILITATDIVVAFHNDTNTYDVANNSIWVYNSSSNTSFLSVTIPIVKNYQPGMKADITFQFKLLGNGLEIESENSVHIIIGEALTTTGNPLLDLIYRIWNEFKNWFINTMKYLFVPDSSQIAQQLQTGWIDIKNTQLLPNLSSSRYLTITMPKELFGSNNSVQLDFGKMTEWNGWGNVKTITRGLIWLVFVYIIIGMVA